MVGRYAKVLVHEIAVGHSTDGVIPRSPPAGSSASAQAHRLEHQNRPLFLLDSSPVRE
jgi:hypothetical protein